MRCPNCGTLVRDDLDVCPACHAILTARRHTAPDDVRVRSAEVPAAAPDDVRSRSAEALAAAPDDVRARGLSLTLGRFRGVGPVFLSLSLIAFSKA